MRLNSQNADEDVEGKVGRDLAFHRGRLTLHPLSVIGRNLNCATQSEKQVRIDPSATIVGKKNPGQYSSAISAPIHAILLPSGKTNYYQTEDVLQWDHSNELPQSP
jgi:hypothetical protein